MGPVPGRRGRGAFARHLFGQIGARSHRHQQAAAVAGEGEVAGPVPARRAAGQARNDDLRRPPGFQVADPIGETHHALGLAHIEPLRVGFGVEGEAEGSVEAGGEGGGLADPGAVRPGPEHQDAPRDALGHQDVAVRGGAQQPRFVKAAGERLHRKPGRGLGLQPRRPGHGLRRVAEGGGRAGRGQVRHRDASPHAGSVAAPVPEGGRARAVRLALGRGDTGDEHAHGAQKQRPPSRHPQCPHGRPQWPSEPSQAAGAVRSSSGCSCGASTKRRSQ